MNRLYLFLIPVLFSCSSPGKFNFDQPLYRLSGSDSYLYFTGDSVRWIGDLYKNNSVMLSYRITGNSIYIIYPNDRYDQLLVRKNELIFQPHDDSFSHLAGLDSNKELKLTPVSDQEAEFLLSRMNLLWEMRSSIISELRNKVAHPEYFLYHSLSLKSSSSALSKIIPDLKVSITWWNTLNGNEWQWNRNIYHIVVQGNKWQIVETKSSPVNMGEAIHP